MHKETRFSNTRKEKEPPVDAKGRGHTHRTINPQYDGLLTCDTAKQEASDPEWKNKNFKDSFASLSNHSLNLIEYRNHVEGTWCEKTAGLCLEKAVVYG